MQLNGMRCSSGVLRWATRRFSRTRNKKDGFLAGTRSLQAISSFQQNLLCRQNRLIVYQVIEVALMPKTGVGTELRNQRKTLQHSISDTTLIKLLVENSEAMGHITNALLIGCETLFQSRYHPGRDRACRMGALEFLQEIEGQASVIQPSDNPLPVPRAEFIKFMGAIPRLTREIQELDDVFGSRSHQFPTFAQVSGGDGVE
jgi:hypothetical protein